MSAFGGQGRCTVGVITLLTVLSACHGPAYEATTERPTPAPAPGFEAVVDSAKPSDQALRDYVGRLDFDTEYAVGDMQRLAVGRYPDLHYGPLAAIQPERGNHRVTDDDLHHGRIIARIINYSDEPYPKLGLEPHSITYWWAQFGPDETKNRSVMISTDSTGHIVRRTGRPLKTDRYNHDAVYHGKAAARWLWQDDDEQGWSTCDNSCCKN